MKLKNILIVVDDIEKSKKFYKDLFGLESISQNEGNVILTEGLVLQDKAVWQEYIKADVLQENNASLLYFEEANVEAFVQKLERLYPNIKYLNKFTELSHGQKLISFYDLDGHLIELRNPFA